MDPELLATFAKLGIPLGEQKRLSNVAVDAVFDSVSIATARAPHPPPPSMVPSVPMFQ